MLRRAVPTDTGEHAVSLCPSVRRTTPQYDCEYHAGHEGNHAAFTWDGADRRVEWSEDEAIPPAIILPLDGEQHISPPSHDQ